MGSDLGGLDTKVAGHEEKQKREQLRHLHTFNGLDAIFSPCSVALIGATERAGSVGRTVLENLLRTPFGGPVYPVNPKRKSVLGVPCHASIEEIPETPDLVIITTPAATVPDIVRKCGKAGVGGRC